MNALENSKLESANWLAEALADCFKLKYEGNPSDWANGRLIIPYSKLSHIYLANEAPIVKKLLEALYDPTIKQMDIRGPTGSGKTLVGEIYIAFCVQNKPGLLYYVWQSDDDGKEQVEDRMLPMFEANDFLHNLLPLDRHKKRNKKIIFPNGAIFYAVGANPSNAQSKRADELILEEPHLYKAGMYSAFLERAEGPQNGKITTLSTGSVAGDESDEHYRKGSCHEWFVPCGTCGFFQPFVNKQLKWDTTPETTDESGEYKLRELRQTVHYECIECKAKWPNDRNLRHEQAKLGDFRQTNFNASPRHRSYHYNALAVHWTDWADLVEQFISANKASKYAALEPLREYVQKKLAEAWDDRPPEDSPLIKSGFKKNDPWPEESTRIMGVDVQKNCLEFWYLVLAFSKSGDMRVIDEGRLLTFDDLRAKQLELNVADRLVSIDSGHETNVVYAECIKYGWTAFKGEDKEYFAWSVNGKIKKKLHSKRQFADPAIGTSQQGKRYANLFLFSKPKILDLAYWIRVGRGPHLEIPQDISTECLAHWNAVVKKLRHHAVTGKEIWEWICIGRRDDHLNDCFCECIATAVIMGILGSKEEPIETETVNQN